MKLPYAEEAVIPSEKLRNYILSKEHPIGRFKAALFERLGYDAEHWMTLDADLRTQHLALDAEEHEPSRYGRKFVIKGSLTGPSGRTAEVVTVWVIRSGERVPRLVTAYPGGQR